MVRRLLLTALAIVLALLALRATHRPGREIGVFYQAGARFRAGADIYVAGAEYPYRYAPGVAALFAPLTSLSFPAARTLWAAISSALAFAAALVLDARVGARRAWATPLAWLCLMQPLVQELAHGQVDVVVLVLALAASELEDRGSEVTAGVLIATAAALKVAPVILALDWVFRRRWRPLAGCALGAIALGLLVLPRYGLEGAITQHLRWFSSQSGDVAGMIGSVENQSLWALARRCGLGSTTAGLAVAALLVLLYRMPDRTLRRDLLLASLPLVSAYGWPQLFVVTVPLVASLLASASAPALVAGCGATLFSLLSYDVIGGRAEVWVQSHRLLGIFLLAIILAGRATARCAARPSPRRATERALDVVAAPRRQ